MFWAMPYPQIHMEAHRGPYIEDFSLLYFHVDLEECTFGVQVLIPGLRRRACCKWTPSFKDFTELRFGNIDTSHVVPGRSPQGAPNQDHIGSIPFPKKVYYCSTTTYGTIATLLVLIPLVLQL